MGRRNQKLGVAECIFCRTNRAVYAIQPTRTRDQRPLRAGNYQPVFRPSLCDECVRPGVFRGGCVIATDKDAALRLLQEQDASDIPPIDRPFVLIESRRARRNLQEAVQNAEARTIP
jgi:hypothetical protein